MVDQRLMLANSMMKWRRSACNVLLAAQADKLSLSQIWQLTLFCLTGTIDKQTVEVTNCFSVPHNESEDEVSGVNVGIT